MLYVSRYSNKELATGKYTAVRISVGTPRWALGYKLDGAIKDLMPFGLLDIEDREESRRLYQARLDKIGFSRIEGQLRRLEALGKPVVLLCYEDITKGPDNWCHRTFFAEWWLRQTGEKIDELPDPAHHAASEGPVQMSLF
ncbi:hypothetical protein [Anaerovibrio slackiae]|uniref:hypothetical protein n=1 Tax=Anaerovibrio slackiae TaxID=2652309 RepID=UPI003867F7C4